MDWADDVAYSVHDVEDGVHAGLIRLAAVDDAARQRLCEVAAELYSPRSAAELAPVLDELLELPTLRDLADYDGSYAAQAAAKRATSELTGRFAGAAVAATRAAHGGDPLGRYGADLVVPAAIAAECALLKAIAAHYVMRRPGCRAAGTPGSGGCSPNWSRPCWPARRPLLDRSLAPSWHQADGRRGPAAGRRSTRSRS